MQIIWKEKIGEKKIMKGVLGNEEVGRLGECAYPFVPTHKA